MTSFEDRFVAKNRKKKKKKTLLKPERKPHRRGKTKMHLNIIPAGGNEIKINYTITEQSLIIAAWFEWGTMLKFCMRF